MIGNADDNIVYIEIFRPLSCNCQIYGFSVPE